MIFKNYRELINYVLHNYPYDKIITYCFDLRYKLVIGRDNNNYTINIVQNFLPHLRQIREIYIYQHCCCSSVTKSRPTLCNPMAYSMPGFPVLHYLPKFAQTHVHINMK